MQWFELYGSWARTSASAALVHQVYHPDHHLAASIYRMRSCMSDVPMWYRVVAEPVTPGRTLIADTAADDLDEATEFVWAWLGAVV